MKKRIKEPSTWAGFAAILQALKFLVPQHAAVIDGLTAAAGSVAVVLRESEGQGRADNS